MKTLKKCYNDYYGEDYSTLKEIYESVEDPSKKWNNKKAKPLIDVYRDVLTDFNNAFKSKNDPKTILVELLKEMEVCAVVKSIKFKNSTHWLIERDFKHSVKIPNKDVKIENFEDIKKKIIDAEWKMLL